jgi:hypothetical protein
MHGCKTHQRVRLSTITDEGESQRDEEGGRKKSVISPTTNINYNEDTYSRTTGSDLQIAFESIRRLPSSKSSEHLVVACQKGFKKIFRPLEKISSQSKAHPHH